MHKLAVAFFYACAILSLPVMVHAVARAGMARHRTLQAGGWAAATKKEEQP